MSSRQSLLRTTRQPHGMWLLMWVMVLVPWTTQAGDGFLSWADKMLSAREHDFGSPAVGTAAKHSIKISNLYKETVTISDVVSSSPDVVVQIDRTSLMSREVAHLEVSLDPAAFGRSITALVTLKMTFEGTNFKTVTVPVTAFSNAGPPPTPLANPNTEARNWAESMFSDLKYDFGSVARGAEAKHVIEITNLYKEDVSLSGLVSSCTCITPRLDKLVLKSKETAQLALSLDTVRFTKKRDVTVSLNASFDGVNFKQIHLPVNAYIRSDVVFEPGAVQFGVLAPGETADRRVRVIYAGRNDWTVRSVRGSNPHLTPAVREVSRLNGRVEYELLVKLNGTAPLGQILDQLILSTDDPASPTIPILVDGTVEADLQISPNVVQFGQLKPGVPKVVNVVVKGRRPFRVEKVECDSARDCFRVSLPPLEKTVHLVGLTITPPNEPGELKEAFTVTIAGRQATLTFQAVGTIEGSPVKPAGAESVPASQLPAVNESVPSSQEPAP